MKSEKLQKRLNKIAVMIDRHLEQIEIQSYYSGVLVAKGDIENPIHKRALAEAYRLEAYHTKQLEKLKDEQSLFDQQEKTKSA